jgi:hypothetical protein
MNHRVWLGRSSECDRQSSAAMLVVRAARDGSSLVAWEGVLEGGEDMGRCLTYIRESLGFVLGFRVSPQTRSLVGGNEIGEKRWQMGCDKETGWPKARD